MSMRVGTRRVLLSGGQGIRYLLRDEYATALAAGSVNGTAAEPGPGTRTVVDVGLNISIAGSALVIASGNADTINTTYLLYGGVDRQRGRTLLLDFTLPSLSLAASNMLFGLANAANGQINNNTLATMNASGALKLRRTSDPSSPQVATLSAATAYKYITVLRTSGAFHFLKTGGVIKLLAFNLWDSTATLYPVVTVRSTGAKINVSKMRVPELLYRVNALVSDSFDRANGALGSTDGAGHLEADSGSGKAWTAQVGTWAVATNAAAASALDGGKAIATVPAGNADVLHSAKLTRAGDNVGLVARYADADNYIYAYTDGTNATIRKVVGGVDSEALAAAAITYAAGARMELVCDATSVTLRYNDLVVGSATIADAALQTGQNAGLYTSNTGNAFNDLATFARNEWAELDV